MACAVPSMLLGAVAMSESHTYGCGVATVYLSSISHETKQLPDSGTGGPGTEAQRRPPRSSGGWRRISRAKTTLIARCLACRSAPGDPGMLYWKGACVAVLLWRRQQAFSVAPAETLRDRILLHTCRYIPCLSYSVWPTVVI